MNKKGARQAAREVAMQTLYAWLLTEDAISEVYLNALKERDTSVPIDRAYAQQLVSESVQKVSYYREQIESLGQRRMVQVSPIEQAVLIIGFYELENCLELPINIIINEAIELSKSFGSDNGHKFVNSVLDKAVPHLRPVVDK